jgi:hypothetical protein
MAHERPVLIQLNQVVRDISARIFEVHQDDAVFVGKEPGKTEIRISFSEATAIVRAVVRETKNGSPPPSGAPGPH